MGFILGFLAGAAVIIAAVFYVIGFIAWIFGGVRK